MMANNTERNMTTGTTMEYFFAPDFNEIENEPAYAELAEMLEDVRNSNLHSCTATGIHNVPGYITEDVYKVLMDKDLIIQNCLSLEFFKKAGTLILVIPYVTNIVLKTDDGWAAETLVKMARIAGRCIIGLVARAVNATLVHDGIFYNNECGADYPWKGKPTYEGFKLSDFKSNKFKVMGICKIEPREGIKYEADGDGFEFEDRRASEGYWAIHNTISGGYCEDDFAIQAYGTDIYYGRI